MRKLFVLALVVFGIAFMTGALAYDHHGGYYNYWYYDYWEYPGYGYTGYYYTYPYYGYDWIGYRYDGAYHTYRLGPLAYKTPFPYTPSSMRFYR